MSTGSAATPLLKAAPEAAQIADRLDGGDWGGLELCLAGRHIADDGALGRTVATVREAAPAGATLLAEAPVAWPSGAFVRVDRLDEEARAGIERSAAFAAAIGSPVLTIHLFAPMTPAEYRRGEALDVEEVERFLSCFARSCTGHGVTPLIENVPPVLRMRTGGVFLSPVGGHWRDLAQWRARLPELGFTLDISHAALYASFARCQPWLLGLSSDAELELERFVEELGPAAQVAHVSDAAGLLGEGLPYGAGELELDPVVSRLGELVPFIVAEINEPDPARSPAMKAAYRRIERALRTPPPAVAPPSRRLRPDPFDWQGVIARRDPVPSVLELDELLGGRRVLITGGAGSIGSALTTFVAGLRPELVAVLDSNEAALARDRRLRDGADRRRIDHVLCDIRDPRRLAEEVARAAPDVIFHLAAYKHVDMAERYPEEFVATNLQASLGLLRAAEAVGCGTVVVASTDKATQTVSLYARTKRLMEQLAGWAGQQSGAARAAVRLVNVLGSAGSASELFLAQARAGVPLTVTDTGMVRFWITMGHAVTLISHAALLAGDGERLATAADPVTLTVGDLARRIWEQAGQGSETQLDVVGIRPGEAMSEELTGPGEELRPARHQGAAPIAGGEAPGHVAELVARVDEARDERERRAVWLAALGA